MSEVDRSTPLPEAMQGRWLIVDSPGDELLVEGGEVRCFGRKVEYDYKNIETIDGALTVTLEVRDQTRADEFQRANITGLVISPDGAFLAYNTRFGIELVRADSPAE